MDPARRDVPPPKRTDRGSVPGSVPGSVADSDQVHPQWASNVVGFRAEIDDHEHKPLIFVVVKQRCRTHSLFGDTGFWCCPNDAGGTAGTATVR